MMWFRRCKMQKVVPVAGQEYAATLVGKPKNSVVGGIARQGLTQQGDIVAELLKQLAQVVGDVMIEQELHSEPAPSVWQRARRSRPCGLHSR
jgi:hypothetical protein